MGFDSKHDAAVSQELAAVRQAYVDLSGEARVGVWWWAARSRTWSPAPDASWHGAVSRGDARWRWMEVVSVRHVNIPGRGRWALVLDAGKRDEPGTSHDGPAVGAAKLVAMSSLTGEVVDAWWFDRGHEVLERSRLADFWVDDSVETAVIHDAGTGGLLLVDLVSRRTHRALEGVVPAGAVLMWDAAGGWLSWRVPDRPVGGRVPWWALRDPRLDAAALRHLVEPVVQRGWVLPRGEPSAVASTEGDTAGLAWGVHPLAYGVAQRWMTVGVSRGLGVDGATAVLQREAARGVTRLAWRRVWAHEP